MFPFMGLRQSRFNQATVYKAIDKLNKNQLKVEDILEEDDLINELKSFTYSHLTQDRLIEFVNYIINEPASDDLKIGYKFPFNACEVLCSENVYVINKLFENSNNKEDKENSLKNSIEFENSEFSGRRSIMMPFSKKPKDDEEETDKNMEINDLDNDIVDPENDSSEKKEEIVSNSKIEIERKIEEIANSLKDEDVNFLDSLESKEDVMSFTKEPELNENNIITSPEYPVIDHLFSLFKNECELNYVLAGYFNKFFMHLLQFRYIVIIKYLLIHKFSYVHDMIKHLNRKSISDCLMKIIIGYSKEIQDAEVKKEIIEKIIESFDTNDEEQVENICDLISEIVKNRRVYNLIAKNNDLLSKIYEFVCKNLNNSYKLASLKILINLIEQVVKDFQSNTCRNPDNIDRKDSSCPDMENENENELDSNICLDTEEKFKVDLDMKNYMNIFETTFTYLEPICQDFMNTPEISQTLSTTFEQEIPKLGIHKIFEFTYIQLIFELIVNVLNNSDANQVENVIKSIDNLVDKLTELNLFQTVIEYFFKYEWNSIYQNLFVRFVCSFVNINIPEKLIQNFFSKTNFIEKIIENSFAPGMAFKSGVSIFPGYFAYLCEIVDVIDNSDNAYLQKIISNSNIYILYIDDEWKYVSKIFIQPIKNKFTKGLLQAKQVESPFKRHVSFTFKQSSTAEEETKFPQLKVFAEDCLLRFYKMKLRKENQLQEKGKFDIEKYLIDEEEFMKLIEKEAEDLTISIQAEEFKSIIFEDNSSNNVQPAENVTQEQKSNEQYFDNNYFWKDYKVDVDLSEL